MYFGDCFGGDFVNRRVPRMTYFDGDTHFVWGQCNSWVETEGIVNII